MKKIKLDASLEKENSTMENTPIKVNDRDEVKKEDVLVQAVTTGDYEKLDQLLSSGISVLAENFIHTFHNSSEYSGAPLHIAAASGYIKCVEILINYGANLDNKDKFGCTALHLACQHGHYPCLKMLLEAGADCCVPIDMPFCDRKSPYVKGTTALHLASKFNHVDCIEELMRYGAKCNAVDMNGLTSLYIAARAGNSESVLTLLKHAHSSSFLSLPSHDTSDTPLHFAVKNGMIECVKLLVRLGADVNHINNLGFSPLHLICCSSVQMDKDIKWQILKILVLEGHNTDISNASREILFQDCDADMKAFLIAYGANINIQREEDNFTLLEYELVQHRNLHLIKCIVNCMPRLPHLKSLNVPYFSPSFLEENMISFFEQNMIQDSLFLHDNVVLRLLRGTRDVYIGIKDSTAQVMHIVEFLDPSRLNSYNGHRPGQVISVPNPYLNLPCEYVNGPDQVVPLKQPFLNLAYEHINCELEKLEHVCCDSVSVEDISHVIKVFHKDQLLKVKQHLWYEQMASSPRTLQHWCRFSIRECMGPSNLKHIKKLPLPEKLLSYLSFECDE